MRFEDLKKELLSDKETRKEYEALEPEFQLLKAMLDARIEQNLSQQDIADRTGINRADISKIENGNANPSLKTMKRIANGCGKKLVISFV